MAVKSLKTCKADMSAITENQPVLTTAIPGKVRISSMLV